ncbi:MAG: type II toxin-antitoxin system HicB family antitoxin [Candidatus Diapherotrites archaeon]
MEKGLDGYFVGEVLGLPGCYSQGKTVKELLANMKEAIEVYYESFRFLNSYPSKIPLFKPFAVI